MNNRQIILGQYPQGRPAAGDFELIESDCPSPADGEVLCKTRFLSLDPYMRSQIAGRHISGSIAPGDMMRGESVGEVLESRDAAFQPGQLVRGFGGWQECFVLPGASLSPVPAEIRQPSWSLSLLGMTGLTAWAGMIWQAQVKPGDRVLIPAVTGAVGSAAAQFCRLHGASVVGTAGSTEKCRYAVEELGVSACINRRDGDMAEQLDRHCPEGIDVYFDLVGGELLYLASERLALNARVVLAGLMAEYNSPERAPGPPPGFWIRARATIYGLVVYDFEARRHEFIEACLPYIEAGELSQREDVVRGIASAPAAFCGLMEGANFGKLIVEM
jgi:NADPH-dependent curcumin reductase CurA